MPYIKTEQRKQLYPKIQEIVDEIVIVSDNDKEKIWGVLNYVVTMICLFTIKRVFIKLKGYSLLQRFIGLIECVKLEVYRRLVAPYEDGKAIENSDVFDIDN